MTGLMPPGPLAYEGQVVVPYINRTFPPTTANNNFNVPTIWIDTGTQTAYILVSKALGIANWLNLGSGGSGTLSSMTGNSGGAVGPDLAGNIDILGDGTTINIVGTPSSHLLTASATGIMANSFPTDSGTAVPSSGALTVHGAGGLTTSGSGSTVTVTMPGTVSTSFVEDSGTATPSSGVLNILGGMNITTTGSGNTITIDGAPPGTISLVGDSGGAVPPDGSGEIFLLGDSATGLNIIGTPGTSTLDFFGIASSSTQVGTTRFSTNAEAAAQSLTTVAMTPSNITSMFSTTPLPVNQGGTGRASSTAYAVLTGGTTSTGAQQSVSGVGTAGQILTSNGAGLLPTWQTNTAAGMVTVAMQVFTANGTYTPTANMTFCMIEVVGGGGCGGGSASTANNVLAGGGGGGGGYSRGIYSAATIGASKTVTVGALGAGAASGGNTGSAGGTSSVGALLSATGGSGGGGATTGFYIGSHTTGGAAGSGSGGTLNISGQPGGDGFGGGNGAGGGFCNSGFGGSSYFGGGGQSTGTSGQGVESGQSNGNNAGNYGSGGSGGASLNNGGTASGGNGSPGVVVITEWIQA